MAAIIPFGAPVIFIVAAVLLAAQGAVIAAMVFVALGRADHASYIADWIKVLRGDKRAIFSAAAHAERAVKFLHGLQPGAQPAGADAFDPDRRAIAAQAFEAAA